MMRAILGTRGAPLRPLDRLHESLGDAVRCARFLRGAHEFRARPDDVFISSYPRSGTTWLQYLLHVLASDGDSGFAHISEVVPWYERSLSLGHERASNFERMPSPRIFKSHLPPAWLPAPARYVYAERDGRDVAVSYHALYRSHLGSSESWDEFFERFIEGHVQYGSWFDHVESWRARAHDPSVCIVRYEALVRDLALQAQRLCAFLGFDRSPARLAELVEACTFESMKRGEARFDHATAQHGVHSGAFLRRGGTGDHEVYFDAEQHRRFDAALRAKRRSPRLLQLPSFLH
jgi:hypothetical protein